MAVPQRILQEVGLGRPGPLETALSERDWNASSSAAAFFDEIDRKRELNAYITIDKERAAERAKASDARRKRGKARALEGIPLAIKDNYCTEGTLTTAGSRILGNFVPTYESFVTRKLLDAGAVFLGKTNMDEFGMGSSTENSAFGPTINPHRPSVGRAVVPGGSSGGSAAAVAAHLCVAALGTDTGGSLRQPAAFCGVVGFKPTYGLCSRWGIIAYASSFDQAGVITKTVGDAAILMDVITGHDPNDSTSLNQPKVHFTEHLRANWPKFRIGVPKEMREMAGSAELESLWQYAIGACRADGHEVQEVSIPSIKYALPAYYILVLSEASSNLARYDGVRYGFRAENVQSLDDLYERTRAEGFSEETKRRILLGTYSLSAGYYDQYFLRAARVRTKLLREFEGVFKDVDFLVWPTTPTSAFEFGSHNADPVSMFLEDVFTVPVNLVGSPAISIPAKRCARNLPLGIQFVARRLDDCRLLQVAQSMERAFSFS